MPTFAFKARDRAGEIVSGTRDAADQRQALEALRDAGFFVTRLQLAPGSAKSRAAEKSASNRARAEKVRDETVAGNAVAENATSGNAAIPSDGAPFASTTAQPATAQTPHAQTLPPTAVSWTLRSNAKEMSLFYRQMYAMIHAGTSLAQALNMMAQHGNSAAIRRASHEMSLHTQRGAPMSTAMRAYPGLFSGLALGMVEAGETAGILEAVFVKLADYSERDYELQQSIKRETWYPKLLLVSSFLIPSVVPLVLHGPGAWWLTVRLPLFIAAVVLIVWQALRFAAPLLLQTVVARGLDFVKLCVPGMSRVVRSLATVKFCRALGALYGAGVAPHRAVQMAAAACGNKYIEARVLSVAPALERGASISEALGQTGQFPGVAMQILQTGETTGTLDTQLDKVADFLEGDAEAAIKKAVQLLGILVFLIMAAYIGSIVVSFYTGYANQMDDMMKQ